MHTSTRLALSCDVDSEVAMGDAEVIDAALDDYLRSLIGDEYVLGSAMGWEHLCRRWESFATYFALLDDAVANPLAENAAVVLATAQSLTSMRMHELGDLLSQAGEALLRKLLARRLK
jgi:hypothetical protein